MFEVFEWCIVLEVFVVMNVVEGWCLCDVCDELCGFGDVLVS